MRDRSSPVAAAGSLFMPRPPDPAKRRDLLDRIREYMIRNGLADLSLRPLARALGTSDRMLLYYFGTKERLVAEALALDERRPLLRARIVLSPPPTSPTHRRSSVASWSNPGGSSAPPAFAPRSPSILRSCPPACSIQPGT